MSSIIKATALLVGMVLTMQSSAQDETLLGHVVRACEADLRQYCSQVTPGESRLLYCVAAHEDKISGQCGYALYQASQLLEEMATAIAYVGQSCSTELETLCGDVRMGDGRVMTCLVENAESASPACQTALNDTLAD